MRVCIPKAYVISLVNLEHVENGHFGANKVYLSLKNYFYWPMRKIVAGCRECQKVKISPKLHGKMHSSVVKTPNKLVCLDTIGPLLKSRSGVTQLLVIIDCFSKLVTLYPLKRATTISIYLIG